MANPPADPFGLLERWVDGFEATTPVVFDVPSLDGARRLAASLGDDVRFISHDYARHAELAGAGLESAHAWRAEEAAGGAIVFIPKGKARLAMVLESAASSLSVGAPLWVVGPTRGGVGAVAKLCPAGAVSEGSASGRRSKLFRLRVERPTDARGLEDFETRIALPAPADISLAWYPGVFGQKGLDDGTRLLLETVPALRGPFVDVGCGAGVIAAAYGRRGASGVAIDSDALAVAATRATLAANGVSGVEVHAGDVLDGVVDRHGRFATVVSNPPFHSGFDIDHGVAERLVSQAVSALEPGGQLVVVVNRFLPYQDRLDRAFGGHEVLADDGRYRVLRATR